MSVIDIFSEVIRTTFLIGIPFTILYAGTWCLIYKKFPNIYYDYEELDELHDNDIENVIAYSDHFNAINQETFVYSKPLYNPTASVTVDGFTKAYQGQANITTPPDIITASIEFVTPHLSRAARHKRKRTRWWKF